MNIHKSGWLKFKQELPSILFLSITQAWLSLNFPVYVRLGSSFSITSWLAISIINIFVFIVSFSYANNYVQYVNLETFDHLPDAFMLKFCFRISLIAIAIVVMLLLWHIDFYCMPHINYILLYLYWFIALFLLYGAANRSP